MDTTVVSDYLFQISSGENMYITLFAILTLVYTIDEEAGQTRPITARKNPAAWQAMWPVKFPARLKSAIPPQWLAAQSEENRELAAQTVSKWLSCYTKNATHEYNFVRYEYDPAFCSYVDESTGRLAASTIATGSITLDNKSASIAIEEVYEFMRVPRCGKSEQPEYRKRLPDDVCEKWLRIDNTLIEFDSSSKKVFERNCPENQIDLGFAVFTLPVPFPFRHDQGIDAILEKYWIRLDEANSDVDLVKIDFASKRVTYSWDVFELYLRRHGANWLPEFLIKRAKHDGSVKLIFEYQVAERMK